MSSKTVFDHLSDDGDLHEIASMGPQGDTKHFWNAKKWDEVEVAKSVYDQLSKKGYRAFRMEKNGTQGEIMTEFDPSAERILLIPQMRGG